MYPAEVNQTYRFLCCAAVWLFLCNGLTGRVFAELPAQSIGAWISAPVPGAVAGVIGSATVALIRHGLEQIDTIWPTWKTLPILVGQAVSRRPQGDGNDEITPYQLGLGLVLLFLLANWNLLVAGSLVFGNRIWRGGECLRAEPIRSVFWAAFAALGLLFAVFILMISVIGLPLAGLMMCVGWFLVLLSAGVVTTGVTGILLQPSSILGRTLVMAIGAPFVVVPLFVNEIGQLLTLFLLLAGFGGLILSGFAPAPAALESRLPPVHSPQSGG